MVFLLGLVFISGFQVGCGRTAVDVDEAMPPGDDGEEPAAFHAPDDVRDSVESGSGQVGAQVASRDDYATADTLGAGTAADAAVYDSGGAHRIAEGGITANTEAQEEIQEVAGVSGAMGTATSDASGEEEVSGHAGWQSWGGSPRRELILF